MKLIFYLCLLMVSMESLYAQTSPWTIEKLPDAINTLYDEIAPVPTRDGKSLYFTRVGYPDFDKTLIFDTIDYAKKLQPAAYEEMLARLYRELGDGARQPVYRSTFNQDVWVSRADSAGAFHGAAHPGYPLNNALPNSLVAITPDPNDFYIVNQFKPEGDMKRGFSSIRLQKDGQWAFPKPVEIKDYYTITSDVNLTMSFDGKVLILSAARYDSRDLDLYICFREGEHQWSAPKHLGNIINSQRREMTPYLSENNLTLYFASDRGDGVGGLDIYMTRREGEDWFSWSPPILLIPPINSRSDESQPYFNMTTGYLYFSSKRDGNSDIFRVRIAPPQPTEIEVRGRVVDQRSRFLLDNCQVQYSIEGSERHVIPAEDGSFVFKIPKGVKATLSGIKAGYTAIPETVFFRQDYYYFQPFYTVDVWMTPLEVGAKIELEPVFFQQSKAIILEQSFETLRTLADLLNNNPELHIRIEGHTDNIGKADDLLQLSIERAAAVKSFLTEQGIDATRIETIGHGAQYPVGDNSSETERSRNRRVEVIITKT